ncbi:MAG: PIN domain-containing protein [Proteobacteria bacterium]|nr:PIN domain-containing protein [Pseudomonadota bacterium]
MVLADTSVWVEHFRRGVPRLVERLESGEIVCHAFVVAELACGQLPRRVETLALLADLPALDPVTNEAVLQFVERHRMFGSGLGLVDMHLLAACEQAGCPLWTRDVRLGRAAGRLGLPDA